MYTGPGFVVLLPEYVPVRCHTDDTWTAAGSKSSSLLDSLCSENCVEEVFMPISQDCHDEKY
jgi:hypothetical protein